MRRLLLVLLLPACASPLPDLPDGGLFPQHCYQPLDGGVFTTGLPAIAPGCAVAPDAGVFDLSVLGQTSWSGVLVVPPTAAGRPLPVVFAFHGAYGTGTGARTAFGLEGPADGGAIFVYPDATAGTWDIGDTSIDAHTMERVLGALADRYCVDRGRVSIAGFSAGAVYTLFLGCNAPGTFQAIAAVAGTDERFDARCCTQPVSGLFIHGMADRTIPFGQGTGARNALLTRDGCTGPGAPADTVCSAYTCPSPWSVDFCPWSGGHDVPDFAGAEIWRFFSTVAPRR